MSREYYRVTKDIHHYHNGETALFAPAGSRVACHKKYDDTDRVFINKERYLCWISNKSTRPETNEEAMEELLIGEW